MKQISLIKFGEAKSAFQIIETKIPSPKTNEVLIKVEGFGINFADVMARQGLYPATPPLPAVIGYEVVGSIESTGENIPDEWKGKRVVALTRFGGYSEYVAVRENNFFEIPENITVGEALALAVQYLTAYYMGVERGLLTKGKTSIVHAAAGGVGLALGDLAKNIGANLIGLVSSEEKRKFILEKGYKKAINHTQGDYVFQINKLAADDYVFSSFNAVGGKTLKKDWNLISNGGSLAFFGVADRAGKSTSKWNTIKLIWNLGLLFPIQFLAMSKSLIGVNILKIGDVNPSLLTKMMADLIQLYKNGEIKPYVGGEFKIEELHQAHEMIEQRKSVGKIVVKW